jgi:hypothetical protein
MRGLRRVLHALRVYLITKLLPFWYGILLPAFAGWIAVEISSRADRANAFQLASLVVQTLGLALVGFGYLELMRDFRRPTVTDELKGYFRDFWHSLRGQPVTVTGLPGGISWGGPRLKGRLRIGPGPSMSIEQRLELLERNFVGLDDEVISINDRVERYHAEALGAIAAERTQREKESAEQRALLESVTIGDLRKEFVGWLWLFGSIVLAFASILS